MEDPKAGGGSPQFEANRELLVPGLRAPLPLRRNARRLLCTAFRLALERAEAPREVLEPAASTGGGLVHACQEFIVACNQLITSPLSGLPEAVRLLLWACRDFLGARDAAYVLKQATEKPAAGGESGSDFERQKGLMEPMEKRFEVLGLPLLMDPVRFAILQVHLDEVYDQAGRQLQRFYRVLAHPDRTGDFRRFARALSSEVVQEMIPDHLLATGSEKERTGLIDLLPELERESAAAAHGEAKP
jgi:hypothetical protein